MENRKIKLDKAIPTNYSLLKIKEIDDEIVEIEVRKVRERIVIENYTGYIKPIKEMPRPFLDLIQVNYKAVQNGGDIKTIISRVLSIIGNDIIIYVDNEDESKLNLFKSKCESIGIQIINDIINGKELLNAIPKGIKSFVYNIAY